LSGHAGVVVTATGADAAWVGDADVDAGAGAVEDVQPEVSRAMQRRTRSTQPMLKRFIVF
jgi:hypothetical protein